MKRCAGLVDGGGLRALVGAWRKMQREGKDVVLTIDGPKGPRHRAKPGALYLAARTGAWLVPVRVKMTRTKRFERAWDHFQLPLPFSGCLVCYGRPEKIGLETLSSDVALDRSRSWLQQKMEDCKESIDAQSKV